MKLVIGFLTYNELSANYLEQFLVSLERSVSFLDRSDFKLIAYDNSNLNKQENHLIINNFNLNNNNLVEYQTTGNNLGFGRAFNIIINQAVLLKSEYFLVLNPDMLIEPEAIKKLVEALDENQKLSALSPKIYYWDFLKQEKTKLIDSLGLILKPGLRFHDLGQGNYDQGQFDDLNIIGPSGAAGIFRVSDLEKVSFSDHNGDRQYFDEKFFMYKEDCDLAYRFSLAGLKSKIVPEAIIYHDRSSGSKEQSLMNKILNRSQKNRQIRIWSLKNQNIIYAKYWKNQDIVNKFFIIFWFLSSFIFSLILEQFNLKTYFRRD
jgi:GT2 family glycosyltransferase